MNLSVQEIIVISVALIAVAGNSWYFLVAAENGRHHRRLCRSAAVAFFIFSLVAVVCFVRAL